MALTGKEKRDLEKARQILERPGFMVRLLNHLGEPIEYGFTALPEPVQQRVHRVSQDALNRCMRLAAKSVQGTTIVPAHSLRFHRRAAIISGGAGGFFGLPGLAFELPVSTMLMFRSIAEVAQSCGEDLAQPDSVMSCMQVFALGGPQKSDDAAETGYFATRAGLAKLTSEAARSIGTRAAAKEAGRVVSPIMARFTQRIATRFGAAVSEKVLAMGVPVLGAVGGATINAVFMRHFQETAWAHFRIRELERIHGSELVRATWTLSVASDDNQAA